MKTNTLKQRLEVYKRALKDFSKPIHFHTDAGFCYYFNDSLDIFTYSEFFSVLPELYKFKPRKKAAMFWFSAKDLKPRIAALKKAIAYTEKKIAQGKK